MRIFVSIFTFLFTMSCFAQSSKVLVAYFSATGTTARQAEVIAKATNGTLLQIVPEKKYTDADLDWRNSASRSSVEMKNEKSRPELANAKNNIGDYDVVFVGYPIWWNLCPRVVNSWIESVNLKGKIIIPFATSGGSTIENSVKDLRALYPEYNWKDGRLLNGSEKETAKWAAELVK